MALGFALSEKFIIDEKTGSIINNNLLHYKLPTIMDTPNIKCEFVNTYDPTSSYGQKSLGENTTISPAPAIRNAVLNATGVAFNKLPMDAQSVLRNLKRLDLYRRRNNMYDINEILEPKTLEKALELLSEHDNLTVIAGGTDVLVKLHEERFNSLNLISIRNIEGLNEIKVIENGSIEIGAMATFSEIFRDDIVNKNIPILAEASVSMGGPQIRNMATIGGNICNGAVSGDSAPSLFALNSKLRLKSKNDERIVKIKDFYIGPGQVGIRKDEILISIIIEKKIIKISMVIILNLLVEMQWT